MKSAISIMFFLLLLVASPAVAKTINKIVAIVNDEAITSYQLDSEIAAFLAKKDNPNQLTASQYDTLKSEVLKKQIGDILLRQRVKELGLTVSAGELENAIADVQRKNGLSREELEKALVSQGMSMDAYQQQIEDEILRFRVVGIEVKSKVMVTSLDIRNYYDQHKSEYDQEPKMRINRISFDIPTTGDDDLEAFYKRVNISRELLLSGDDLEKVLSAHGSAASGGSMGMMAEKDLTETLREALKNVDAGGVSAAKKMN